jgi:glycogen synthase
MNLQLSLKTKWFELTDTNGKTEDYREVTPYWYSRLCLYCGKKRSQKWWEEYFKLAFIFDENPTEYQLFTHNVMTLGYPKSTDISRIKIFEHAGIEIGYGKEEWGAEPNKLYFIIKHGKRIQ